MIARLETLLIAASANVALAVLLKATLTTGLALGAACAARRSRAAVRHVLLVAAFGVLIALPVAAALAPAMTIAVAVTPIVSPAVDVTGRDVSDVPTGAPAIDAPGANLLAAAPERGVPSVSTMLAVAWMVGAVLTLLPVLIGLWQVAALRRSGLPWLRGRACVASLVPAAMDRRVDVVLHEHVEGPMTCGAIRHTIVLPRDADSWPAEDLHRALVHELEHARRADWFSQCLARVVCAIYWFHPLVWVARRTLALEAERACDDAVLVGSDAASYAEQLVDLAARLSGSPHQPFLAMAGRRDLATRVRALLDRDQSRGRAGAITVTAAVLLVAAPALAISPLRLVAEPQSGDRFDVASVRPHQDAGTGPRDLKTSYGARGIDFRGLSLGFIIGEAYAFPVGRLVGASGDVTSVLRDGNGFDVEAKADRPVSKDRLRAMLQSLLADRFHLVVHHESRSADAYRLLVAAGGPHLTAASGGDLVMTASPEGFVFRNAELMRLEGRLTKIVGRDVVDATGLAGTYDFTLKVPPDSPADAGAKSDRPAVDSPAAGRLAGALKDLGLRLESGRVPVDYLVVDHVEQPSAGDSPQSAPQRFEAVSIRPCVDDTPPAGANGGQRSSQGGFPTISPGRFTIDCGTVERLISNAYVLNGDRLENNRPRIGDVSWWKGGPEWIRYDKFTIEASAPGVTDRAVLLGPMLRTLLEERFALKLHRETQDVPMYGLTVAKGGLKVQPMPPDGCVQPGDLGGQVDPAAAMRANADAVTAGTAKPMCSGMTMMGSPGHARWTIGGTTMPNFAGILTGSMDHFVMDKTGLDPETKYNIHLEFAPDEHVPGVDKRNPRTDFPPPDAPNIFSALEQQLGLKLDSTKGPQGVLVIDHVEHPKADGAVVVPMRARGAGR